MIKIMMYIDYQVFDDAEYESTMYFEIEIDVSEEILNLRIR